MASVQYLPHVLAGLVALMAVASLFHVLTAGVARRRRDLAVLRIVGFTGRQLAGVLSAQATTFALIAAAIGVPARIALGRWAWGLVAGALGVATDAKIPMGWLAVIVIGVVAVANLLAAGPGWAARHIRPAVALRTE